MAPLGLSGPALFGLGMAAMGLFVLAVSGRYVWRATGIYRATGIDALARTSAGSLIRVTGTIDRGSEGVLTAPFTDTECQAIRYAVEERRLSPYGLPWFVTIHETAGSVAFRVRTAASEIDVTAPARSVTLQREVVATVPADEDPPERIARFERDADGIPRTTVWRDPPAFLRPLTRALSVGKRRYTEECAEAGEEVTVVGRVTDDGDAIEPVVVSDRSPRSTAYRMAKTSITGLTMGVGVLAFGLVLVFVV